jgi:hypothetical protein
VEIMINPGSMRPIRVKERPGGRISFCEPVEIDNAYV